MPAPCRTRALALLIALGTTVAAAQGRPPEADLKRALVVARSGFDASVINAVRAGTQARNNLQVADLIARWIDAHVEQKARR